MNKHLSDGRLRAALDGEAAAAELEHLNTCELCRAQQERIRVQVRETGEALSFLAASPQAPVASAQAGLHTFYQRTVIRKENFMLKRVFASPVMKLGLALVLIVAIVLSVPATRALADQLLGLFRVQQVVVVPVDFNGIKQLTGNSALGNQISQLISGSTTVEQKPAKPATATDAAQASQMAGFNVRLPQGMTASRLTVQGSAAFSFKVDRAKAQALLNEAGRSDLVLPQSIDGAKVAVTVPASVTAAFGTCPDPAADNQDLTTGSIGRRFPDCVMFAQIPSPTVSAPADVNIPELAAIGLEFTGMSHEQAAAFAKTVDWTSSLVVPIPKNAASYEQVTVDGVTGTLIKRPADDAPEYLLIWVKDGIVYAVSSLGADTSKALQIANSLP